MFEKCSPAHPDKLADRIAGAIVDLAYKQDKNPKIAVEVLIGHGMCHIIAETSVHIDFCDVEKLVKRIAGDMAIDYTETKQDPHLAKNQEEKIRCGDNGIFKGVPVTTQQRILCDIAKDIYKKYPTDGKYILDGDRLVICQSRSKTEDLKKEYPNAIVNPLGDWTGGTNVDAGATNRKLGSDMGDSVTGGGLCLSGDTEYLGEDLNWHRIDSYKFGKIAQWNDGKLEFVEPLRYIQNEKDELIHIYNCSKLSMCLTPYHQVLIRTSKGNLIKKDAQEIANKLEMEVGNSGSIIHSFNYKNDTKNILSKYPSEDYLRLQVAFCADGSILGNSNKKWRGRIRVKKAYKKERLRELLKTIPYKETQDGDYSIFWVNPIIESKSLYECFKDEDWGVLYDEIYRWDGNLKRKLFRTTKKQDADFVQLVIASFGKVATIGIDDRIGDCRTSCGKQYLQKSITYTVSELKSTTTCLRKSKDTRIWVDRLNGESYCFEVPSHNLIVRHNNRVFVTGNCGKDLSKADVSVNIYAWLKAQALNEVVELSCAIGDETIDGRPYHEIVEVARDYINNIGGFEKFAEWGLIR